MIANSIPIGIAHQPTPTTLAPNPTKPPPTVLRSKDVRLVFSHLPSMIALMFSAINVTPATANVTPNAIRNAPCFCNKPRLEKKSNTPLAIFHVNNVNPIVLTTNNT